MKHYWESFSLREKKMLILGGLAICIFLLITSWNLLNNLEQTLQSQISTHKKLLTWMQQADETLKNTSMSTFKNTNTQTLATLIQTAANKSQIASTVTQLQKTENDTVEMTLKDANFDEMILFLNKIWTDYHLTIIEANISRTKTLGIINATLTLK